MQEKERRIQSDIWTILLKWSAIISWLVFTFALIMSYYAAPDNEYGVLRYHGIEVRKFWLTPLTGYLYILLWISALISYLSIILNQFRTRRSTDHKYLNSILLFIISVAWLVYILMQIAKN
ncbi:hypothetical protein [Thalassotalea profundi]|uniref:Uncharacterized protein n=1 Tax=Thalassotalea profundi TaxID=2036687 RepID=A0ABQ3IKM1_9GAMM|nr:hypothetical protein [Thalassotalea profundi]GHE82706.1 hypothetical protein GCM10011501_08740 [Thalassotalea profundi]